MSTWHQHAIFWHVYPLGFVGAEPALDEAPAEPAHRLSHLVDWLDYAVELGVSGLLLGPVFTSASHGYDTVDHLAVDPRLGDRADLDRLIEEAHARGLKVVLDGVFNHVGDRHPLLRRAIEAGAGSPEAAMFHLDLSGPEPSWRSFEGHRALVELDHDSPAVVDLVTEVMRFWLAAGVDGWRLDAAYAVPPSFWQRVLPGLREQFPEMYVLGEVIHGDYAALVDEAGWDSLTQYELWKATWSGLNDVNLFELAHALGRHDEMLGTFAPQTFVGNHDVTRIASRLTDPRHLPHALVVLLTVGGTPSVYYGDEQGFTGVKEDRSGGDDAVRPAFPETPDHLSPHGWPLYRLHQELIGLRRRHAWLHRARTEVRELSNEVLVYTASADDGRVLVALNIGDEPVGVAQPWPGEVLAGHAELGDDALTVPPHGWAVLGATSD